MRLSFLFGVAVILLRSGLAIALPILTISTPTNAQSTEDPSTSPTASNPTIFVPPPDDGLPRPNRNRPFPRFRYLIALLPPSRFGTTTKGKPPLYFYHPEADVSHQAMLVVTAADGTEYHETYDLLPGNGIAALSLPAEMPELTVGERYIWQIILMPEGQLRPDNFVTRGEILRIEPVFSDAELSRLTLAESAEAYGEAGVWYDLIATLAQMKAAAPDDAWVTENWQSVLMQVGVEHLADQPLLATF